jgi:hypothetical protein
MAAHFEEEGSGGLNRQISMASDKLNIQNSMKYGIDWSKVHSEKFKYVQVGSL